MIHIGTRLQVSDNSGAKTAKCLIVVKKPIGFLGDIIKITLRRFTASKKLIKGKKYFGLLISVVKSKCRLNGY